MNSTTKNKKLRFAILRSNLKSNSKQRTKVFKLSRLKYPLNVTLRPSSNVIFNQTLDALISIGSQE